MTLININNKTIIAIIVIFIIVTIINHHHHHHHHESINVVRVIFIAIVILTIKITSRNIAPQS